MQRSSDLKFTVPHMPTHCSQEFECTRLTETLASYGDNTRLSVRLGRALLPGEHRGKVYLLDPHNTEDVSYTHRYVSCLMQDFQISKKVSEYGKHIWALNAIYWLTDFTWQPARFLIDWVVCKGDTIAAAKRAIVREVNARCNLDLTPEKVRLRKKSWKNPQTVYLDHHRFDDDISFYSNWELFLQVRWMILVKNAGKCRE